METARQNMTLDPLPFSDHTLPKGRRGSVLKNVGFLSNSNGAFNESKRDTSKFLRTISMILCVKDVSKLAPSKTLVDCGMDSLMGIEISQLLERDFSLSLTQQEVNTLTVGDILQIPESSVAYIKAMLRKRGSLSQDREVPRLWENTTKHFNLDELVPRTTIVKLNDRPESGVNLFLVHPIEGSVMPVLSDLVSQLDFSVYGLNSTASVDSTSIPALAADYIKEIKSVQNDGPYHIGGYSFGASVAFEMALQLQRESPNSIANLILLDGSPAFLPAFTRVIRSPYLSGSTDADRLDHPVRDAREALEIGVLVLFVTRLVKTNRKLIADKLLAPVGVEERLKIVVDELKRCPDFDQVPEESVLAAARSFLQRYVIADRYVPESRYDGHVNLISCTEKMVGNLSEFYDLEKMCKSQVQIRHFSVNGTHESFVLGENARITAAYINKIVSGNLSMSHE